MRAEDNSVVSDAISPDQRVAAIAARQHGLVTFGQLRGLGFGPGSITVRVKAGRLHRVHRGVYAVGHRSLSQEARWMGAVLWAGEGAVLSHLSAACLWQIWRRQVGPIDVLTAATPRGRREVRAHRHRGLEPSEVTRQRGIPVTTPTRTLVDLADVLGAEQLANVIHEAAFRRLFDARRVRSALERANGRRGQPVLEAALKLNDRGSSGTRSGNEERFLALARRAGLAEPIVNTRIATAAGPIEVDFRWGRLVVEVDGEGHKRPRSRREDQWREALLRELGYEVLRVAERDLRAQPQAVVERVLRRIG